MRCGYFLMILSASFFLLSVGWGWYTSVLWNGGAVERKECTKIICILERRHGLLEFTAFSEKSLFFNYLLQVLISCFKFCDFNSSILAPKISYCLDEWTEISKCELQHFNLFVQSVTDLWRHAELIYFPNQYGLFWYADAQSDARNNAKQDVI